MRQDLFDMMTEMSRDDLDERGVGHLPDDQPLEAAIYDLQADLERRGRLDAPVLEAIMEQLSRARSTDELAAALRALPESQRFEIGLAFCEHVVATRAQTMH